MRGVRREMRGIRGFLTWLSLLSPYLLYPPISLFLTPNRFSFSKPL
jgi:hypothetical protein